MADLPPDLAPTLPRWTLEGLAGERVLVVTKHADEPGRHVRLPPEIANRLIRSWLLEPSARGALLDMYATIRGALALSFPPSSEAEGLVELDLTRAFESGALVLLAIAEVAGSPGAQPVIPPKTDPPKRPTQKSWIEIEMVDEDGAPVETDLLLTLPDGTKRTIPFRGFVRVDDIDPGTCDIEFPKIDAREWQRSQGR